MKKRVLILISTQYPYGKSEDFIANELNYLEHFDEVLCYPILVKGIKYDTDISYNIPNIPIIFHNNKTSEASVFTFIKYSFQVFASCYFYQEIYHLFKSKRLTFYNFKKLFLFLHTSFESYNDLKVVFLKKYSNVDLVLYSYWMHMGAFITILLKKKFKNVFDVKKILCRCHRFDLYEYAHYGNYIPMRNIIFKSIDEIHSISNDGIGYLKANYHIDNSKIKLSRLGSIDRGVKIFNKGDALNIVSCSWMRPVKRIPSIINAIRDLNFKVNWVHYGDGDEYSTIKALVDDINNPLISCTLKGAFPNEKVLEDYAIYHYDIFINVSESEGVPVSIMEAMSFGKIIVATDVGGTSEIVENGVNGYLLPKDFKNEDLIIVLEELSLLNEDQFKLMCNNSRRIWEEKCNAESNYRLFFDNL